MVGVGEPDQSPELVDRVAPAEETPAIAGSKVKEGATRTGPMLALTETTDDVEPVAVSATKMCLPAS
jgi:hypothetical protein